MDENYRKSIEVYSDFIFGKDVDLILEKLKNIEKEKFINYESWTWIEPQLMLKCRLTHDTNIKNELKGKVIEPLNQGNELQQKIRKKVFQRVLNGEELQFDLLENAKQSNNKNLYKETLYKIIMQLVLITEFEGSEKLPLNEASSMLKHYIEIAKNYKLED